MAREILTDEDVADVRRRWSERVTVRSLAAEKGCSEALIERILYDPAYRNPSRKPREGVTEAEFEALIGAGSGST